MVDSSTEMKEANRGTLKIKASKQASRKKEEERRGRGRGSKEKAKKLSVGGFVALLASPGTSHGNVK